MIYNVKNFKHPREGERAMLDSYGRSITYLRLSVTELCNLRCRYCMPEDGVCKKRHEEMLSQEEMLAAIRAAASLGITKLRITGGEPLVKPNIVALCREAAAVEGGAVGAGPGGGPPTTATSPARSGAIATGGRIFHGPGRK